MEYLLNQRNIRILESFCLVKTLFAFDYDGTLAPIVDDPAKAIMKKETSEFLIELNTFASIAIISGRKASDVRKLLPIDPFVVIGNHGAEGIHSEADLKKMKSCCQEWIKELELMSHFLRKFGITIEDKVYSLSFHFRNSPEPEAAKKHLELILFTMRNARVTKGKLVLNLIPEFSVDKGMALDRIMKEHNFEFGVYFGDDYTDEDVFRFTNPKLLTVKVGIEQSLAKYFIKGQEEMEDVLCILKSFMLSQRVSLI